MKLAEIAFVDEALAPHIQGNRIFQWQNEKKSALIYLTNALGAELPEVGWGDGLMARGTSEGQPVLTILSYKFWLISANVASESGVTVQDNTFKDEQARVVTDLDFSVCTFNLLGFGQGRNQYPDEVEYREQLHKRALTIATQLQGCTVIGL